MKGRRNKNTRLAFLPDREPVIAGKHIIHVSEPDLSGKELPYVSDAVRSTWVSSAGEYVSKFENAFAKNISHTRYAVAVNSGTSALHLSLLSAGIGLGDEVILPTFTMIATANAVRYCGATPVFVDADPVTWNMDVRKIESAITRRTKAILPVHIYGSPVEMDVVLRLARKYHLRVVEDASEAHGAEYRGGRAGSLGDVGAFSLYANKIITTGEGGMVTTNDRKIAERVATLRDHAFARERHFWHKEVGYSYNMSNLQAAVGLAQAERFEKLVSVRRSHAKLYSLLLKDISGLTLPTEAVHTRSVYWVYGILVDKKLFGVDKNDLRRRLGEYGIETRSFFIPIHVQPPYGTRLRLPVSERLCRDGLYLPSGATLTEKEIQFIASRVRSEARKF